MRTCLMHSLHVRELNCLPRLRPYLILNAGFVEAITADGARVSAYIPRPHRNGIPFLDLETRCHLVNQFSTQQRCNYKMQRHDPREMMDEIGTEKMFSHQLSRRNDLRYDQRRLRRLAGPREPSFGAVCSWKQSKLDTPHRAT